MKTCLKCGSQINDESKYCSICGARADGKKLCPACNGEINEGSLYCSICGARVDGKVICPVCGKANEQETAYCPDCGASLKNKEPAKKKVEDKPVKENGGIHKPVMVMGKTGLNKWLYNSFALATAVIVLVFSFLIGWQEKLVFGDYIEISNQLAIRDIGFPGGYNIIKDLLFFLNILSVTTMLVLSIVFFIKRKDITKYATISLFSFLAVVAFFGSFTIADTLDILFLGTDLLVIRLSDLIIVGICLAIVAFVAMMVFKKLDGWQKGEKEVKEIVFSSITYALLIVAIMSLCFMISKITRWSYYTKVGFSVLTIFAEDKAAIAFLVFTIIAFVAFAVLKGFNKKLCAMIISITALVFELVAYIVKSTANMKLMNYYIKGLLYPDEIFYCKPLAGGIIALVFTAALVVFSILEYALAKKRERIVIEN